MKLVSDIFEVKREWSDYKNHLNVAHYMTMFDQAADQAHAEYGIDQSYIRDRHATLYIVESHVRYMRELLLGSRVRVTFQLLGYDAKRVHYFQELFHSDGWCAARAEFLSVHIDMSSLKVADFPVDVNDRLRNLQHRQSRLPFPEDAGKCAIGKKAQQTKILTL